MQYHRKRHSEARTLLKPSSLLDGGPLDGTSSDRDDRGEVQFPGLVASFIQFATTAPTSLISHIRDVTLAGEKDKAFKRNYVRLPHRNDHATPAGILQPHLVFIVIGTATPRPRFRTRSPSGVLHEKALTRPRPAN
ncbi:hypothetical protein PHLGIDRAFT_253108 [Phlebiopsis gigantea 11061_1 CR5-6]|uniref:Uncharacterized protein n=1 Tax=Phlebiopsis gigantea (strain 11061_1 CR5-6) TaxID=745531 RepID=A0A0C3PD68_PHLG1|nr:hypothetical protein PHLGIDRAFT_253108 [Phlebiopsis gigantea 11061_1 CR5-6]